MHPARNGYTLLAGQVATFLFALIIGSSLWRRPLGIEYDRWRFWHGVAATAGLVLAFLHLEGSGHYLQTPAKRSLWGALALVWLLSIAYVRLLRPWLTARRPYRVVAVERESGRTWAIRLAPQGHPGFAFSPGQFAWVTFGDSPLALREHPYSIASAPAADGQLAFVIKELGDFTRTIGNTAVGSVAYVDGPYGVFSVDRFPAAAGFVFVAGGVGIAPVMSMLRTLAERGDRRPLLLVYGNRRLEHVVFRAELAALEQRLALTVVHVLGEPPDDWTGESGLVTKALLSRYLPTSALRYPCFICGPSPMIVAVEQALGGLGVGARQMHSEIFELA